MRDIEPWDALLARGRDDERLVRQAYEHAREGAMVELPRELHPSVVAALRQRGVDYLWGHQAEALAAAFAGPTMVTTGTASGKSLCFQLPTLEVLARDATARALYLYPSKALAQDQARALHAFGHQRVKLAIYDGDTPREQRAELRRASNLDPHQPRHAARRHPPQPPRVGALLPGLAVVVIDEAHVYRGVFGSHVANVLRRLRRICEFYGTAPRFLFASATIANPGELATRLTGLEDVRVISRDGSPGMQRTIAMWNPPVTDPETMARRSALAEAADLLAELVIEGARTIVFIKSRKAVELMATFAAAELKRRGHGDLASRIAPYRAGYTPAQRRELEGRLVRGELLGVVSTDALELGIDIGALDAAICVTFPGTVASLKQMWGRAGRRGRGLAVYVAGGDALDQFFCRHPDEFLERPVEAAILDHENEQLYATHLLCAAHEAPLEDADASVLGPRWRSMADVLVGAGELRARPDGTYVPRRADEYPAGGVSLRSARVGCRDDHRGRLGRGDRHGRRRPGAVDRPPGRDLPARRALVRGRVAVLGGARGFGERGRPAWYTQPKRETETLIERVLEERTALGVRLCFGTVVVTEQVLAYQRRRLSDHEAIDLIPLELPPASFMTQALWYELVGRPTSGHCTPPSTRRSPCCRCWRCATAGTSAASRPTGTRRPAGRRSSSTMATRAGSGSPAAAIRRSSGWSRRLPARERVPVRVGLPVVRAVAQVRQFQRAARQGRLRGADAAR